MKLPWLCAVISGMTANSILIGCRALAANPLRTVLSTLGVIMGTGALVAVLSVGDGVEAFARRQLAETTDLQLLSVVPRTTRSVDGVSFPRPDTLRFTPADLADLTRALGPEASAVLRWSGAAIVTGLPNDSLRATQVVAQGAGAPIVEATALAAGRWFNEAEANGDSAIAIISPALAGRLTGSTDYTRALGQRVTVQGTTLQVIGVTTTPATPEMITRVPFGTFPRTVLPVATARPPMLLVQAQRIEVMPAMIAKTTAWTAARWPGGKDRVDVQSRTERINQARQSMLIFKLLMGSITGISLLVGGIGIMNVMLASVLERTREIGVRRATGARRRDILTQFLAESVAVTGAGSALGVLLGAGVAIATTAVMRAKTQAPVHAALSASTLLIAALSAIIIGMSFGLYPATRAARLSPIDAIRTE
ncbi:MAG: ABC transporter permease [Gemmatimonadota bacterium]